MYIKYSSKYGLSQRLNYVRQSTEIFIYIELAALKLNIQSDRKNNKKKPFANIMQIFNKKLNSLVLIIINKIMFMLNLADNYFAINFKKNSHLNINEIVINLKDHKQILLNVCKQ